jgi:ABC-type multidrug transport system permease subunit
MSALVFNNIADSFAGLTLKELMKEYLNFYTSLRDVTGSLFFLGANVFTGLVFASIMSLQLERAVLLRELSSKCYGLPAYFISKNLFEFPLMMVFPLLTQLITFWCAPYGAYARDTETFAKFYLVLFLTAQCAVGYGYCVSAACSN